MLQHPHPRGTPADVDHVLHFAVVKSFRDTDFDAHLRANAEAAIERATGMANDLEAELARAPRVKADREALRLLRTGLREVRERIARAQSELQDGRVRSAHQEIREAVTRADGLLEELRNAKERMRAWGGRRGGAS